MILQTMLQRKNRLFTSEDTLITNKGTTIAIQSLLKFVIFYLYTKAHSSVVTSEVAKVATAKL